MSPSKAFGKSPSSDAVARCGVRNAVKIAKQQGDPLVLAKTPPFICSHELDELRSEYFREYGKSRGGKIYNNAGFAEVMVEVGTAIIVKERSK
jgi:hypothetical protein